MKELEVFTAKDLRIAERVMLIMGQNNIPFDSLTEFNKVNIPRGDPHPREISARLSKRSRAAAVKRKRRPEKSSQLLLSGETYLSELTCGCGGKLIVEGICPHTAMREGYIRSLICLDCNKEFKVR